LRQKQENINGGKRKVFTGTLLSNVPFEKFGSIALCFEAVSY
jgi:hypothetical protein